jgi:hypothetical protein
LRILKSEVNESRLVKLKNKKTTYLVSSFKLEKISVSAEALQSRVERHEIKKKTKLDK